MCPNCRAFITTSDSTCPYCGEKTAPRAVVVRQHAAGLSFIPEAHFTTVLILIINFGLFLATMWLNKNSGDTGDALGALGAKYGPAIFQQHQYWRLVTAGFLHGGWLHILMNSWVLYDLGAQVEQVYGTPRFLVVYFAGTVGGFYLSAILNPNIPSIGSSAGIMGLIGAMIAYGVANRSSVGRAIRDFYTRWVIYVLVLGFIPVFRTDNWAHIGGLAAGFVIGYVADTPVRAAAAQEGLWRVLAGACVALTLASFFMVYLNFPAPGQLR